MSNFQKMNIHDGDEVPLEVDGNCFVF